MGDASQHKKAVALASVFVSAFLAISKLIVGFVTGSLAVFAQAADNFLDLVTTLMTYLAVRIAEQPPDADHPYGHGKAESLSALAETGLLIVTCGGIAYQAVRRLVAGAETVSYAGVAIGLMLASILIDLVRTVVLRRTARRHHSPALEADALNFTGDILSSAVVIAGLIFTRLGAPWADPLAGLMVAGVVMFGAVRLARQAIDVLLDREPEGLAEKVRQIGVEIDGVIDCRGARARRVGNKTFVEVTIGVDRAAGLEAAHDVASEVEAALQAQLSPVDVVVHVEPVVRPDETPAEQVTLLAQRMDIPVHHVSVSQGEDGLAVDLHCEIAGGVSLQTAHQWVSALEREIRDQVSGVVRVTTHIEPRQVSRTDRESTASAQRRAEDAVADVVREVHGVERCRQVDLSLCAGQYCVSLYCLLDGELSVEAAHRIASELEMAVRQRLPEVHQVTVHTEPTP
jgi:cation diffusion facilitator family transporter